MFQPINSAVIVGSGSAGWLTALVLKTRCPFLNVSLVRPQVNRTIGVGESTQPDFPAQLQAAGVDLGDLCVACDATMKCGIFYRDWNTPGDHYWHPFTDMADSGSYTAAHHYQQMINENPSKYTHAGYYSAVHTSYDTCVNRNLVAPEAAKALHVDAARVAAYLEDFLSSVRVVESGRVDPQIRDDELIGIALDDGAVLEADIYIDCTGFSRALVSAISRPEFLPYTANVNRAVAANVPYVDALRETYPYTGAHAHESGWTWCIPLQSRIGSGYVYNDDFCSPEQAERNFRDYWGNERMRDVETRHISFKFDTLCEPWVKNVIAVGLSAGFIEPLEATGLNWTITSAELLTSLIGARYYDDTVRRKYNALMMGYVQDVQDFVDAHYVLSSRRDSDFWRYQASREVPERLQHRLSLYAQEMPNVRNRARNHTWAFNEISWIDILNGYEFRFANINPAEDDRLAGERALAQIAAAQRHAVNPRTFEPVAAR